MRRFIGDVRHLYEIKYLSFRIIPCRVDLPFCRSLLRRGKEALRNRIIMTLKARRAGAKLPGFLTLLAQLQDNSLRVLAHCGCDGMVKLVNRVKRMPIPQ